MYCNGMGGTRRKTYKSIKKKSKQCSSFGLAIWGYFGGDLGLLLS